MNLKGARSGAGFKLMQPKRNARGQMYWQRAREVYEKENCAACKSGAGGHYGKLVDGEWDMVCKSKRDPLGGALAAQQLALGGER